MKRRPVPWRSKWLPVRKKEAQPQPIPVVVREGLSQKISVGVQAFTVVILSVSLFWTVRPTYQKEQLAEDVARLTMAANQQVAIAREQTRVAADAKAMAHTYEVQVLQARSDLEAFQAQTAALEAQLHELETERVRVFSSLADLRTDHRRLVDDAEAVAWTVFVDHLTLLASEGFKRSRLLWLMTGGEDLSFDQRMTGMFAVSDMDPWSAIQTAITTVSSTEMGIMIADMADLQEFESRAISLLESYESHFECSAIDSDAWTQRYQDYLSQENELVAQCVEESWQNRAVAEGWSSERLSRLRQGRFGTDQSATYYQWCSSNFRSRLAAKFSDPLGKAEKACSDRLPDLYRILNGERPAVREELAVTPPSGHVDLQPFPR